MGRPSKYSPALGKKICTELMLGKSLRQICIGSSMPTKTTVCRWLADEERYKDFCDQYARARQIQAEMMADELMDIADDGTNDWMERQDKEGNNVGWQLNGEHVQRSRLRVDTRKWAASKLLPKKYGEKLELAGNKEQPLTVNVLRFADTDTQ